MAVRPARAAVRAEQTDVRATREPSLGHASHPGPDTGAAQVRAPVSAPAAHAGDVVPAPGRHGLPDRSHLFLGGVRWTRGTRAGRAAARTGIRLPPSPSSGRVR